MASGSTKRLSVFPGSDGYTQNLAADSSKQTTQSSSGRLYGNYPRLPLKVNVTERDEGQSVLIQHRSPWELYKSCYSVELGDSVAIAHEEQIRHNISSASGPEKLLFTVRSFSGPDADRKLYQLRQIRHENFLRTYEVFAFENAFFVISEYMAISINEIIASPAYPDERQLATIIVQVLQGISFLISQDLMHGHITCSKILLSSAGDVKIANPEYCHNANQQNSPKEWKDIQALGFVMKRLMEKGAEESGNIRLDKSTHWSKNAVDFLTLTMTASAEELASHTFLLNNSPWKGALVCLVAFAQTSARRFYKYNG